MTPETKESLKIMAEACAFMVTKADETNEVELSDEFIAVCNKAVKLTTPIGFFKMICDELRKGQ